MTERKGPQIFLSHASADKLVAREVVKALERGGVRVWADDWELSSGESIASRLEENVSSSDFLLVLLSKSSVQSRWVQSELGTGLARELQNRAITVIPAVIDDCEIPASLAERVHIDLRDDVQRGIQKLIDQLSAVQLLEFSALNGYAFEILVADLLREIGFSVEVENARRDSDADLVASFRSKDPFGAERTETWLVETKLYREQRFSVSTLHQLVGLLATSPRWKKGLLVTNSTLTSVAREYLAEAVDKLGRDIRVIDGSELKSLLIRHPDVVRRHFAPDPAP